MDYLLILLSIQTLENLKKIPDVSGLVTNTALNTQVGKVKKLLQYQLVLQIQSDENLNGCQIKELSLLLQQIIVFPQNIYE